MSTATKPKPMVTPIERLRAACLKRGASGIKTFGTMFRIMDDNGNHNLSLDEFQKGCKDYGAGLDPEEVKALFQQFDKDNSGEVSFDEILMALRPPMSETRVKVIEAAFKKMDKSGDGFITVDDLKRVYNVKKHPKYMSGEWDEDKVLKEYLRVFDTPNKSEFLNYYAGVSASIDTDVYFQLMMTNAWKL